MFRPVALSGQVIVNQDDHRREELKMKARHLFIKGLLLLLPVLLLINPLSAQWQALNVLTYDVSFPFRNTKAFTTADMSWLGVSYQFRYILKPNLSAGVYLGWQVFHGEPTTSIAINQKDTFQGTISGKQSRYINAFPIMLGVHYYIGKEEGTRAFFGLNVGAMVTEEKINIVLLALKELKGHFALAPEAGVMLPLGYNFNLLAGVRYNYAFTAGKSFSGDSSGHAYLSLNIGISYLHTFSFSF
jgi:hypothetical protein